MDTVAHIGRKSASRKQEGFAVTDDLAGLPVSDRELDAVEAFLSQALKNLLSTDSEPPQTSAMLMANPQQRGPRHEIRNRT